MFDADHPLRHYWHPVARVSDLGEKPKAVKLLGEDIVLWRSRSGVNAFSDICVHRGTRLSLGWIKDDEIVCPYHGWCYSPEGAVTSIPAVPKDRAIPVKARTEKYRCEERYGLVFVCMGEPRRPIFQLPAYVGPDHHMHVVGLIYWKSSAARSLENFLDEAHLPWAHHGYLGNRDNVQIIPSRDVQERNGEFYYECQSECNNRIDPSSKTMNRMTYTVGLPFTIFHGNHAPDGTEVLDLFLTAPVDEAECVRFMVVWRNYAKDQPDQKFIDFTLTVWEQDRVLVENQRPERVPVDLSEELHVRGPDGPSVIYRRMLAEMGIKEGV
jgi:phenylpropionate dioxygenase-like ring-hydroxylating dioxygenase large terminal subunit